MFRDFANYSQHLVCYDSYGLCIVHVPSQGCALTYCIRIHLRLTSLLILTRTHFCKKRTWSALLRRLQCVSSLRESFQTFSFLSLLRPLYCACTFTRVCFKVLQQESPLFYLTLEFYFKAFSQKRLRRPCVAGISVFQAFANTSQHLVFHHSYGLYIVYVPPQECFLTSCGRNDSVFTPLMIFAPKHFRQNKRGLPRSSSSLQCTSTLFV